jgi:hypothetical protein
MWHVVAHAARGRWLFRTWWEGLVVWRAVLRVVPVPEALVIMPDHLHLLCARDAREAVGRALGGVARWRNHAEGVRGPLVRPLPEAVEVVGSKKRSRAIRYAHMNPNRAGLARDPLAWPLSTHRDAVGLTWPRVGPRRRDVSFHRYVSSDPSADVGGTELPGGAYAARELHEVVAAVSAVLRLPAEQLGASPYARSLVWDACCELCPASLVDVASELRVGKRTMSRRVPVDPAARQLVRRVLLDPRFPSLHQGLLVFQPGWAEYGRRRGLEL